MNRELYLQAARGLVLLPAIFGVLLFVPAGTLDFWQAWLFIAVFFLCSAALTVWLAIYDPALLERRMKAGPRAEKEPVQKIIVLVAFISFFGILVIAGLDHRFGWSRVTPALVIIGNALIAVCYYGFYLVMRENSFSAATIQIAEGQRVISTGPYALVRHPMYSVALILILAMPLALGSWWAQTFFPVAVLGIVWRLIDEENFLVRNLPGYADYKAKVAFRLIPSVW